jgi:hypothetical protein
MNMRQLHDKLDSVNTMSEAGEKFYRQDPEGAIARAQAGASGYGLLGALGGYALANRNNQGAGNMQQQNMPMRPGTTTVTTGPATPVGQPYLDTANTVNYNRPSNASPNIAPAPAATTTNKPPKGNDALEDADIAKLNALVDQLEKTLKEGVSFDIANALMESFGYQLDEKQSFMGDIPPENYARVFGKEENPLDKPLTARGTAGTNVEAGRAAYQAPGLPAAEVPKVPTKTTPNFGGGQMQGNVSNVKFSAPELKATTAGKAAAPEIAKGLEKVGVKTVAPDVAKAALKASGGKMLTKLIPGVG